MSLATGRFSATRFRIVGKKIPRSLEGLNPGYRKMRIRAFNPNLPKELVFGWAPPSEGELELFHGDHDLSHCQVGSNLLLRLRVERKRVPQSLSSILYREKIFAAEQAGEQLSREEKKVLLEDLKKELLTRCLPEIRYIEGIWHFEKQFLSVLTTAKRDLQLFEDLFRASFTEPFQASLVMVSPILMAFDPFGKSQDFEKLEQSTPTLFSLAMHL